MAKGDVTMKFDADTADFVQKMTKLRQDLIASGSASRQFAQEISLAGVKLGSLKDVSKSVGSEIQNIAASHLSFSGAIGTAMNLARAAWDIWGKHVEEISRKSKSQIDQLSSAVANMGAGAMLPEVRMRLQNQSMPGMNMEQRIALFKQASADNPDKSIDQLLSMTQAASKGRLAGQDPSKLLRTMGVLDDAGFKGDSRQLADKANKFLELSGGRSFSDMEKNSLLRFTSTGTGTLDEGLGFMLGSMKSGGEARVLGMLVDKIAKVEAPQNKLLRSMSAKDKAQARLAKLSMPERFRLLTRDRGLANDLLGSEEADELMGGGGSKLAAVMASGASEFTDKIGDSQNSLARTSMHLREDPGFAASLQEDKMLAEADDATMKFQQERAMRFRMAKAFVLKRNAGSPVRSAAAMAALDTAEKAGLDAETVIAEMSGEALEAGGIAKGGTVDEFRSMLPDKNALKAAAGELQDAASALGRSNREGREELLPPHMETGRIPARQR